MSAQPRSASGDLISYTVNAAGIITSVAEPAWSQFARANQGEGLERVVGRPLWEFISGAEAQESYRLFHEALLSGRAEQIVLRYQCDGPAVRRAMQLELRLLRGGVEPQVRYTSTVLGEEARRPVAVLGAKAMGARAPGGAAGEGATVVRICSYCRRVSVPGGGVWLAAEVYEAQGGSSDVVLSHGLCRECREGIVDPIVRQLRDSSAAAG